VAVLGQGISAWNSNPSFIYPFSFFIERSCFNYKTYRLEEVTSTKIIVKRSADEPLEGFVEFAGKALIKYNIINLADLDN
jgi:hypothetical protein